MTRTSFWLLLALTGSAFSVVGPSCQSLGKDCMQNLACVRTGGEAGGLSDGAGGGGAQSGGNGPTSGGGSSGGSGGTPSGGNGGEGGLGGDGGAPPTDCGETTCTEAEPYCDEPAETCVECLEREHCSGSPDMSVCKPSTHRCVECAEASDCLHPSASACVDDACEPCTQDEECAHLQETPACDAEDGTCVECTPANETACGGHSCHPLTLTCTTTVQGSRQRCEACVADSECTENYRCIPMFFDGMPRESGYCLKLGSAGGCERPFTVLVEGRESLSGAAGVNYCGISEERTTCEAVLDLLADEACSADDDCGVPGLDDARCETVNLVQDRCTYSCDLAGQCPSSVSCGADANNYCGYATP